ncbi:unnamed protein product [Closterium sp. Naga37s-1]|nr:unnamed protein product [Closterium sp. Naga37s-1]
MLPFTALFPCCLSLPFLVSVLPFTAFLCCHAGLHCLSLLSCCLSLPFLVFLLSSTSLASCHAALHCLAIHHPCVHIPLQAMKLVEVYELEELKDSKMPVASEEAIVDFADLALDCIKSPGTRRPTMKDVAYRLSALIAKHCPNKEDEWENVAEEDGASNVDTGTSSRDVSAVPLGDRGRESERSYGSQSGFCFCAGAPPPVAPCVFSAVFCLDAAPAHGLLPLRCSPPAHFSPLFFCHPHSLLATMPSSPSPASGDR